MNCPVCEKEMHSPVCACGYDMSRDYEKYPTFAPVPKGLVCGKVQRNRRNDLVRCAGCGGQTFVLGRKTGRLACSSCGMILPPEELKPLADALGMKKAREEVKSPQNLLNVLSQIQQQRMAEQKPPVQTAVRSPRSLLDVLGKIQQRAAAESDGKGVST